MTLAATIVLGPFVGGQFDEGESHGGAAARGAALVCNIETDFDPAVWPRRGGQPDRLQRAPFRDDVCAREKADACKRKGGPIMRREPELNAMSQGRSHPQAED